MKHLICVLRMHESCVCWAVEHSIEEGTFDYGVFAPR